MVSLIIPNYNGARYLNECLKSIACQEWHGETILVDDKSTDNSLHIAATYPWLRIVRRQRNGGTAAARNDGIAKSIGEYIAFLDSDDMLTPGSITRRLDAYEKFPFLDISCGFSYIVNDDITYEEAVRQKFRVREGNTVHSPTGMIRRSLIDMHGGFDTRIRFNEDKEFWFRMLVVNQCKCVKTADPVAFYRVHGGNKRSTMTKHELKMEHKNTDEIIASYGKHKAEITDMIQLINYGDIMRWVGFYQMEDK